MKSPKPADNAFAIENCFTYQKNIFLGNIITSYYFYNKPASDDRG